MNIREPVRSDLPDIKLILNDTELFPPEYLDEMIEPFFADPDNNERWLVLETEDAGVAGFSYGLDDFKDTRNFYETRGYVREAIIRDYWADGDDKVIYWKSLNV
jgi:ribosomal protein S18 acetylase RimI-like enzyme